MIRNFAIYMMAGSNAPYPRKVGRAPARLPATRALPYAVRRNPTEMRLKAFMKAAGGCDVSSGRTTDMSIAA